MSNKTSDKNVANVTKNDIDILNALIYVYEARLPNYNELMDSEVSAIKNILSDYTRQKQINEEHRKLNGELREKVKELEEKNKHLSNASDYETISLECTNLEEQLEIANDRIKELEEENHIQRKQIMNVFDSECIPKQVVIDLIENETIDISGFECIAVEDLQELLEGEEVKNVK